MKRKTLFFSMLVTFICFLFLGFLLPTYTEEILNPRSTPARQLNVQEKQQNLVIIHTDQIGSANPELHSVTVAVLFHSNSQSNLTFVQIYPPSDPQNSRQAMAQAFDMDHQGNPDPTFWREFNKEKIKWDGFVVIDDQEFATLKTWLANQPASAVSLPDQQNWSAAAPAFFQAACQFIQSPNSSKRPTYNWSSLEGHFHTDLAFDSMMAVWGTLVRPGIPTHCQVSTK